MLPRIWLGAALLGGLFAAGLGAYSDKLQEAAKSDAELRADAENAAARAARDAEAAAEAQAAAAERQDAMAARLRWNGPVVGLTLFVLALFVGFTVLSQVPARLHTPLLSSSTALGGVILVGAISLAGVGVGGSFREGFGSFVGMLAVGLATFSVVGGFLITHRMLIMQRRK